MVNIQRSKNVLFLVSMIFIVSMSSQLVAADRFTKNLADDTPWWQRGVTGNVVNEPVIGPIPPVWKDEEKDTYERIDGPKPPIYLNTTNRTKEYPRRSLRNESNSTRLNTSCVQGAIEERDSAIMEGFESYTTMISSALAIRKDALKAAWTSQTAAGRKRASYEAWTQYRSSVHTATKQWKSARESAWRTFKIDLRKCGPGAEGFASEGADVLPQA
jgi:hypothetical protein